jgi:hypothetical protein
MGGALELRMEHFLVVSISVIVVLLILVIAVTLLLVHVCRRRIQQKEAERQQHRTAKDLLQPRGAAATLNGAGGGVNGGLVSCHMPKNIQMGTSKLPGTYMGSKAGAGVVGQFVVMPPDLLTEAALVTPDSSCVSMDTVSTPCHSSNSSYQQHNSSSTPSDHSDISSIMKDYGNLDRGQPIIGQYRTENRSSRGSGGSGQEAEVKSGRKKRTEQPERHQQAGRLFSLLASQDTYPPAVPPPPPLSDDPALLPPWTSNNPYIHTSRPYRLPLVKPVGPDEQYPKSPSSHRPHTQPSGQQAQQDYAAMAAAADSLSDPLYESITSLRYPPGVDFEPTATTSEPPMLPSSRNLQGNHSGDAQLSTLRRGGKRNDAPAAAHNSADSSGGEVVRTEPVIRSSDSVQDILRKLSGDYAVRADSPEISRELEYAFLAQTEETNI